MTQAATARAGAPRRRPRALPWRDRQGRFSWLKAVTLAGCVTPGVLTAYWLATHQMGARPFTEALHETGLWTIRFLLISLALTPARLVFDWPRAPLIRRMVGVTAACYGCAHLLLYVTQQDFHLLFVASEIVHRVYLTIGFVALTGLGALAATSTDAATRRMGRNWKRLHRAAYVIATLGLLHYFIQSKANVGEPVVFAGLFLWLMMWRVLPGRWGGTVAVLPLLGLAAAALAACVEFAWYGLATHVNAWRVLAANERFALMRPAHWVLVCGGAILALALLRRAGAKRAGLRRMASPPMLRPRQS